MPLPGARVSAAALFDLPPPVEVAPKPRTPKPGVVSGASEPCPWRIRGKRCNKPVAGVDPMRTCEACFAKGAPARVPWEMAKPEASSTVLPELVVVLANAHLSESAVHIAEEAPARTPEPALVEPVSIGTFPCGHPRFSIYGFCGPCNPARL